MPDYTKAVIAAPMQNIDKVLFADTPTITVPAGSVGTTYVQAITLEGTGNGVCVGIYTDDGGSTFNDLAKLFPVGHSGYATSNQMLPDVTCEAFVTQVNNTTINFRFTRNVTLSSSRDVKIYYALLTIPDQGMTIPTTGYGKSKKAAYSTNEGTYLKLAITRSYGISASETIPHGLGHIPMTSLIIFNTTYGFEMGAVYYDPNFTDGDMVKMDSTNVYTQMGQTQTTKLKVYLEN